MYSLKLYSPLRYPGGKARFAPFIANVMEVNGLAGSHYLEAYAGGAGAALELLIEGHASHVHLNDADPAVHAFWSAVVNNTEELLKLVNDTPVTMDEWYRWRLLMNDPAVDASPAERGFATLFLNRTNRAGILKGGVTGGKAQEGRYKLDARYDKVMLTQRIERVAKYGSQISVYCEDALALLQRCDDFLPADSMIYLDPPYYVKGASLYRRAYTHAEHAAIAEHLQCASFRRAWLASYDNAPEISLLYEDSQSLGFDLHYCAQKRQFANELMLFKNGLKLPEMAILPTVKQHRTSSCLARSFDQSRVHCTQ